MRKTLLNIFTVSLILTTIGFIMDGDPKVPGVLLRFAEFFLMLGIISLLLSAVYFGGLFVKRSFQKLIN